MPQCSVPQCTNVGGHQFPKSPKRRKEWVIAIKRDSAEKKGALWSPGSRAIVCRDHFDENDYVTETVRKNQPLTKRLKKESVPHIFHCWKSDQEMSGRTKRMLQRQYLISDVGNEEYVETTEDSTNDSDAPQELPPQTSQLVSVGVQTHTCGRQRFAAKTFSDTELHYYTGLESYKKFCWVLDSLGPAAHQLNYYGGYIPSLAIDDQFLMTLIKLRTHPPNEEVSILFGICRKTVSNIFITWINFMYIQWQEIDWWPSQETVRYYTPTDFHLHYPNTRLIIDGTEIPIQKPQYPIVQQSTFSTYKNRNTMKILVGATPGGLISYISEAYGGSTSDRQIVERSKLPRMCEPTDEIMADKGFNVDDLFLPYLVNINIPSFFKKKNRMSCENVVKDRKIASKRVHIERIIGLGKTYKILKDTMSPMESSLATQITTVVYTLCNFRSCIVPDDA